MLAKRAAVLAEWTADPTPPDPARPGPDELLARLIAGMLIPGTADAAHLHASMAVGEITLDAPTLATLDAVESRSNNVPIG